MTSTLFIINPVSARGATLATWTEVQREISKLDIQFIERVTSHAGEAVDITREAIASGIARVIAVGGDGTLSEVVNGYLNESRQARDDSVAIGLMPSGTGSDFRRSVGLTDWRDTLRALIWSKTRMIDAAQITFSDANGNEATRAFINIASFGLGGEVSAHVNRWRKSLPRWIGGRARFTAAAIRALESFRSKLVKMRIDGVRELEISSNLIVIANGRFAGGGMKLAPNAELNDGLLDVILTDKATRLDVIRELPRIRRGGYLKNPKVTEMRAREVVIESDEPMAIDVDGEMVGFTPARLSVLPQAIRFLIGQGSGVGGQGSGPEQGLGK